ncbi:bZIP transcription factor bZIP-1 [Penicillium longicatenatum]|nr:bZIP transcription factor bZIP-1 [Penicillium longicatenatum]
MAACACSSSAAGSVLSGFPPSFNSHDFQFQQSFNSLEPTGCFPSATSLQSFDSLAQEPDLWTSELSFANTDWNFLQNATPYPAVDGFDMALNDPGYGVASAYPSLSDSGSIESLALATSSFVTNSANSQDGHSHASPASQVVGSVTTSQSSPASSQTDSVLGRVESSRVEKRRLNTLAARRCRQRRVDQTKNLENELELMRKERDELRLKVSKLEGETAALKGLLARQSK